MEHTPEEEEQIKAIQRGFAPKVAFDPNVLMLTLKSSTGFMSKVAFLAMNCGHHERGRVPVMRTSAGRLWGGCG